MFPKSETAWLGQGPAAIYLPREQGALQPFVRARCWQRSFPGRPLTAAGCFQPERSLGWGCWPCSCLWQCSELAAALRSSAPAHSIPYHRPPSCSLRAVVQEDLQAVLSTPAVDPGNCSFVPGLCGLAPRRELRLCLEVLYYSLSSVSGHEPNRTAI